jgi:ariadne-1
VLGLRLRHARTLLIYHRWNVEGLFGKLADKGEEELFREAGLPSRSASTSYEIFTDPSPVVKCGTCLEEVPQESATRMDCGHSFCNECMDSNQMLLSLFSTKYVIITLRFTCLWILY